MQSVMQAAWLLTIAFGNLIVIVVAEAKGIPRQVYNDHMTVVGIVTLTKFFLY